MAVLPKLLEYICQTRARVLHGRADAGKQTDVYALQRGTTEIPSPSSQLHTELPEIVVLGAAILKQLIFVYYYLFKNKEETCASIRNRF